MNAIAHHAFVTTANGSHPLEGRKSSEGCWESHASLSFSKNSKDLVAACTPLRLLGARSESHQWKVNCRRCNDAIAFAARRLGPCCWCRLFMPGPPVAGTPLAFRPVLGMPLAARPVSGTPWLAFPPRCSQPAARAVGAGRHVTHLLGGGALLLSVH